MFRLLKDKAISLKLKSKLILSFMLTSVFILLLFALFFLPLYIHHASAAVGKSHAQFSVPA